MFLYRWDWHYEHGYGYTVYLKIENETRIYILYNYKLYKLIINIYVYKYVLDFFESRRCFSWLVKKKNLTFIIVIKMYTNKFEFLENYYIYPF